MNKTQRAQNISAAEAKPRIIEMRKQGFSIRQIAKQLEKSVGWVHKHEKKALEELAEETREQTQEYKALQVARYESMLLYLQPQVKKGNPKAIGEARRILDSLSKLLGANAPVKLAATDTDGEDVETGGIFVVPAVAGSVDEWLQQYSKNEQ